MIDWSIAGEWAAQVQAVAMVESTINPDAKGDYKDKADQLSNQARGLFQWHPAAFAEAYGLSAKCYQRAVNDSWVEADIKALAAYFQVWAGSRACPFDTVLMAFHLGRAAVFDEGKWDQPYLNRFNHALGLVKAAGQTNGTPAHSEIPPASGNSDAEKRDGH